MLEVGNVVSIRGSETLMSVAAIDESSGTVRVIYAGDGGIVTATIPASCLESEEHARAREVQRRLLLESHRHQNRIDEIELIRNVAMQLLLCLPGLSGAAGESDPKVNDPDPSRSEPASEETADRGAAGDVPPVSVSVSIADPPVSVPERIADPPVSPEVKSRFG